MATDQYLNVGQNDLRIEATWNEDLTGYAAKLYYYREKAGEETEVEKNAMVTAGETTSVTYVDFEAADDPFAEDGYYIFSFEIEKDGRSRRCRPIRRYVHIKGQGWRR
jgi:hypothetical protein